MQSAKLPRSLFPLLMNNRGEKFGPNKRDFGSTKFQTENPGELCCVRGPGLIVRHATSNQNELTVTGLVGLQLWYLRDE
jgi:hypothetical protein